MKKREGTNGEGKRRGKGRGPLIYISGYATGGDHTL